MKVIQVIPRLDLAGAEIMCENLSSALNKIGVEVIVISLFDKKTVITERLQQNGIKIYFLNKRQGFDFKVICELLSIFKSERPDVVHSHINALLYTTIASIFGNIKCRIHTVHSVANKEATPFKQKLYYLIFKYFKVKPVALTEEIRDSIINRYRIEKDNIPVIFNGIDLNNCIKKNDYEIKEYFQFLHIGRFYEVKNHKMLINAFKEFMTKHPNSKLNLVGTGPLLNETKQQVKELGLCEQVIFWGQKDKVFEMLTKADVFILPSIYEGMPMTLIEAMGSGLPIIATNVGGIPSMIKDNYDGMLVNCELDSIIEAMEKMENLELRKRVGTNAAETAKKFSAENMANNYLNIYMQIINS